MLLIYPVCMQFENSASGCIVDIFLLSLTARRVSGADIMFCDSQECALSKVKTCFISCLSY